MADELELIQAMSVLQVRPGDVVVLKTPMPVKPEQARYIREAVRHIIGNDKEVLILSDGMDIGVIRDPDYIDMRTLEDA